MGKVRLLFSHCWSCHHCVTILRTSSCGSELDPGRRQRGLRCSMGYRDGEFPLPAPACTTTGQVALSPWWLSSSGHRPQSEALASRAWCGSGGNRAIEWCWVRMQREKQTRAPTLPCKGSEPQEGHSGAREFGAGRKKGRPGVSALPPHDAGKSHSLTLVLSALEGRGHKVTS